MADNLFALPPQRDDAEEIFEPLLDKPGLKIERILSFGQPSPQQGWFNQPEDEWVTVLEGHATLEIKGKPPIRLTAGAHIFIPAHTPHRVLHTRAEPPTIWLAVHG